MGAEVSLQHGSSQDPATSPCSGARRGGTGPGRQYCDGLIAIEGSTESTCLHVQELVFVVSFTVAHSHGAQT